MFRISKYHRHVFWFLPRSVVSIFLSKFLSFHLQYDHRPSPRQIHVVLLFIPSPLLHHHQPGSAVHGDQILELRLRHRHTTRQQHLDLIAARR